MNDIPTEGSSPVSGFPIKGSQTKPFFPPVCLRYHWDPTQVLRHVVPQGPSVALPLDPRPATKVCLEYVNSGHTAEQAPAPPKGMVFPTGGEFYPPNRYAEAINRESLLRRLDRPLGTCDLDQYEPNPRGDMYNQGVIAPERRQPRTRFVEELAMPQVLMRTGPYPCFQEALMTDFARSPYLFNNATKQQRYNQGFRTKKMPMNTRE